MGLVYFTGYWTSKFIAKTLFGFRAYGREHIIEDGPAILAMNHESFLDPPLAGICCKREIYYLARKTLLDWPLLGPLFPKMNVVPVDQDRADSGALKAVIRLIRQGHSTVIFPEGSRTMNGALLPAQPGLGFIIAKTMAPVVPMRIFGAHQAFPRGGKPRPFRRITINIAEPIRFTGEDLAPAGRDLYQRLSERVMERIAAIENPRP
jgi:1-acyl-sn-glycerol-3-phosphate acyltransferase